MVKARIFCFIALMPLWLLGQKHVIKHELNHQRKLNVLTGSTQISFASQLYSDSVLLHLPSKSLELRKSFYHLQLLDFQKVKPQYAKQEELGFLTIDSASLNGKVLTLNSSQEHLFIAIPSQVKYSDSVKLKLYYQLHLPHKGFAATGANLQQAQIIDWLPRLAPYQNNKWQAYPVNYFASQSFPLDSFNLTLGLESQLEPITNLKKARPNQEVTPFFTKHHFSGISRNLQIFWQQDWHTLTLPNGVKVYSQAPSLMLELSLKKQHQSINQFYKNELNDSLNLAHSYVYLNQKLGHYQSAELLSLNLPSTEFEMAKDLAYARAQSALRYKLHPNGFEAPWLAQGLPYYYLYHFIKTNFPQEYWVPFSDSWLGRLFDFDGFDYGYQNQFLHLFLARQGLDQKIANPADSLTRLNHEGITLGKTYLLFSHLRAYLGPKNFKRALALYYERHQGQTATAIDLQNALDFYSNKPLNWFFGPALQSAERQDYQITRTSHCPTVTTATVRNPGPMALPYSITGYKNGQPILTEWFEGHLGKRTVQLYNEEYDKVVINHHLQHTEYRQKNNRYYPKRWLLKRAEPLNFAFYNSFEEPQSSQIFYFPSVNYNAYDLLLLGVSLTNTSILVQKPFEYQVSPTFSTGTQRLTGSASARWNFTLPKTKFFRQISVGGYGQYFHYDEDLSFLRLSPSVNFRIRKPHPTSPLIQSLRLRAVAVSRELTQNLEVTNNKAENEYAILQAGYRLENTALLNPTIFRANLELSTQFSKAYIELDQRLMLPNRKWFIFRLFGGLFLNETFNQQELTSNQFSFGLSGTQDYLFDYAFIGRSETQGLWSRQFFTTDGGFKTETGAFANTYLVSTNVSLPLYSIVGLFADGAYADDQLYWDYGVRLALVTDFLELYLPVQNQNTQFLNQPHYLSNLRFVLDLDLANIINRLRRGYY